MTKPIFEIVRTTTGAVSIRNNVVNEIMHNPVGPWLEANALYIQQSGLSKLLNANSEVVFQDPLVVYDVGLGAGTNAVAAIQCLRNCLRSKDSSSAQSVRKLHLVSFEKDLALLEFTLENIKSFDYLEGFEEPIQAILNQQRYEEENLSWDLYPGDFIETMSLDLPKANVIFYDPYSPKVNNEMWTRSCFEKLRNHCCDSIDGGALLMTYSQATRIRVAMLLAGFFLGYGSSTGLKEETTMAATERSLLKNPLGKDWYLRWQRSHQRLPFDSTESEEESISSIVHKYFLENDLNQV